MLHGCKDCWAYHLLKTIIALGLVDADQWQASAGATVDTWKELQWDEDSVRSALLHVLKEASLGSTLLGFNPRVQPSGRCWLLGMRILGPWQAPSAGLAKITHDGWVYPYDTDTDYCGQRSAPAYTLL